jgi:hypothetical protein
MLPPSVDRRDDGRRGALQAATRILSVCASPTVEACQHDAAKARRQPIFVYRRLMDKIREAF